MLRHSLIMHQVSLPNLHPDWPVPLDLELGLNEVLLLEGVGWNEARAFWQVAATLDVPAQGEVLYWGKSRDQLPRTELSQVRKQIAYIAPGQVLLQHRNLGENIALAKCYHQELPVAQVLEDQEAFLDRLGLQPFLNWMPAHLPLHIYWRGIWARELVKDPELVLACLEGPGWMKRNQEVLREALEASMAENQGAFLLAGRDLSSFYPLAHRVLRPAGGTFSETLLLQSREKSPVTFFPLA